MKPNPHARNLNAVNEWGKYYLEHADEALNVNDVDFVKKLRDDLWEFTREVEERWLTNDRITPHNRATLQRMVEDLRQSELLLARRIVEIHLSQTIMSRMESVALPEPTKGVEARDFSSWNRWPFRYSAKLRSKLAHAKLPE